jgi:hypothetical protein
LSETNALTTFNHSYDYEVTRESKAVPNTGNFEPGLLFGAGVRKNRFGLEVRFEKASGMTRYKRLGWGVTRYYGLLSYRLFKSSEK